MADQRVKQEIIDALNLDITGVTLEAYIDSSNNNLLSVKINGVNILQAQINSETDFETRMHEAVSAYNSNKEFQDWLNSIVEPYVPPAPPGQPPEPSPAPEPAPNAAA
jgi:hypothetical protein